MEMRASVQHWPLSRVLVRQGGREAAHFPLMPSAAWLAEPGAPRRNLLGAAAISRELAEVTTAAAAVISA